jgi:hypothetical protein
LILSKVSSGIRTPPNPDFTGKGIFFKINPDEENLRRVSLEPRAWALPPAAPPTG